MASNQIPPPWVWDENHRKYRHWSASQNIWLFEDGTQLPAGNQAAQTPSTQPQDITHQSNVTQPQTVPSTVPSATRDRTDSVLHNAMSSMSKLDLSATPEVAQAAEDLEHTAEAAIEEEDYEEDEDYQRLDAGFQKRKLSFFKTGKVIKVLWPENLGNTEVGGSVVADSRFREEKFLSKIRWFIILKEGKFHCCCLPIQTYGGKGAAKRDLIKSEHSIVYTDRPIQTAAENPSEKEEGMRAPIRVKRNTGESHMDYMSRINFNKIYTVEKNVKVYDYGTVHPGSEQIFLGHFRDVWAALHHAVPQSARPSSSRSAAAQNYAYTPSVGTHSRSSAQATVQAQAGTQAQAGAQSNPTIAYANYGTSVQYANYGQQHYGQPPSEGQQYLGKGKKPSGQ